MRIQNVGTVSNSLDVGRPASSDASSSSGAAIVANSNAVTVSPSELQMKLDQTPDVRQQKVASLQQAISQGTYQVSGQSIANAMFQEFFS